MAQHPGLTRLVGRLKRQGGIAHKNAAARFGQRSVQHQAGDDIACAWYGTVADFNALRGVNAHDDASTTVDLAVDPDLPVIVGIRFEPYAGAGQIDPIKTRGNLYGDTVPGKCKAYGAALPDVRAHLPTRVVIVRQTRGSAQELCSQALVRLAW